MFQVYSRQKYYKMLVYLFKKCTSFVLLTRENTKGTYDSKRTAEKTSYDYERRDILIFWKLKKTNIKIVMRENNKVFINS